MKIATTDCRDCKKEVSLNARACLHCGAPRPWKHEWHGSGVDWKSKKMIGNYPLIHIAFGRDAKGKLRVAKGIIAIGQFGIGLITFAQFGIGVLFGFGQFIIGLTAVAQFAGALYFAIGQFVTGYIAIGQVAIGYYVFAQVGFAEHVWSVKSKDPEAIQFFLNFFSGVKLLLLKVRLFFS
ncbi:MAG: hypothetical protein ABII27_09325 [bacterium]